MNSRHFLSFFLFSSLLWTATLQAQQTTKVEIEDQSESTSSQDDTIYVIGSKEKAYYTPGSAHFIDQKELKTFDYTDPGRVLDKVPGVYIQEEDGLGLRPNIGLRGAHPHRSRKVTLMEDGILIGPAPYSAPAAYYFPSTTRMNAMEVYKGPSAVQYGPNSIGGAINMVTSPISQKQTNEVDLSGGFINQLMLKSSGTNGRFGYLIQAGRRQGDLVRQISGADDLTFEQNDVLLKMNYDLTSSGSKKQYVSAKLSYADEDSDETYLGLSNNDFAQNSRERYRASVDDRMEWQRAAAVINYGIKWSARAPFKVTAYHHDMQRTWYKFNELSSLDSSSLRQVLATDLDQSTIDLLKGNRDSQGASDELIFGNNARRFFSQGVQASQKLSFNTGSSVFHDLSVGLRVHRDQVSRDHSEINARMVNGNLNTIENSRRSTNRTQDTSNAYAFFLQDEITTGSLTTLIGTRVEHVETSRDFRNGDNPTLEREDTLLVPGIGLNYSLTDNSVLLAGVNRGVTLVGPGQDPALEPESAINYEMGFRMKAPIFLETVAFYSDYENIKGTCSFSAGCTDQDLSREFSGGRAEVFGLESILSHTFTRGAFSVPVKFGYTYTVARFKQETVSDNNDWGVGTIVSGDPLPYIPVHQLSFRTGLEWRKLAGFINFTWKDKVADQAVADGRRLIPSYGVFDLSTSYQYSRSLKLFARLDNIFAQEYVVSLRPFGLRPGKPRSLVAGLNYVF